MARAPKEAPPPTLPRTIIEAVPSAAKLAAGIAALDALLTTYQKDLKKTHRDPVKLARAFVAMHRLNMKLDEFGKRWEQHWKDYKTEVIPNVLDEAGLTNVPLAEGFRVGTSTKTFAGIREGKKDDGLEWLRKNGLGDLIYETYNSQALSSAVAYMIEEENKTPPDDLFNVASVNNTSVTRTEKKGK